MALFHPATDSILRVVLGVFAGTPVAGVVGLLLLARSPLGTAAHEPIEQPLEFDHRHHAGDEGLDCRYCHDAVMKSATAGIPPSSRCMGCHAQIWNESEILKPVRESFFNDSPIAWNRVHRLPDFVFFNHAVHVNRGMGCATCHGRVDQMAHVAQVAPLTMGWCLECHRNPAPHLRPLDAIAQMDWKQSESSHPEGESLMHALNIQPRTECTTCHR